MTSMDPSETKLLVVAGATGYLGSRVCKAAKAAGWNVRALSRRPLEELPADLQQAIDEVFVGRATDATSLDGLCDGAAVVFSSLGNRTLNRSPSVWDVDWKANLNIIKQAESYMANNPERKRPRMMFVSVYGGEKLRGQAAQIEARERVVDVLAKSDFPYTVIRPSGFFNDLAELQDACKGGVGYVIGQGSSFVNPISGEDLADFCVQHLHMDGCFPVGGPETFTYKGVAELACKSWNPNAKPTIRHIPEFIARSVAWGVNLFNGNVGALLHMLIAGGTSSLEPAPLFGKDHLDDFFKKRVTLVKESKQ